MGGKLTDLRTLSAGFLDLAHAALAPPPVAPKPQPTAPPAPVVAMADPNRTYTMGDREVSPPAIIRQDMPRLTPAMKAQAKERGVIEVVIDELGRVSFAAIRTSVHPMFDAELLGIARDWKYLPAMLGGKPVKYRKMIQINVTREQ
jgi:TonB family protein